MRSAGILKCRTVGRDGSWEQDKKENKVPRLHPKDFFNIIDPPDPFLTEFPVLKLDRLRSAALLGQEEQEKHKGKCLRIN